ncbi:hypothetical protein KSS87_004929 [Heliosperma pusillum]|nr:hypothetical protein KSS87_004929 [Heliosperma pusillum]
MVSLRRRRLLGLCTGVRKSVVDPLEMPFDDANVAENDGIVSSNTTIEHRFLLDDLNLPPKEAIEDEVVVKRRKQYRRRNAENYEPMRGVYFKNSKWQAAIKVDKKQIHLGTLNSQAEAVKLYDRAAFLCGRDPNFALSQEVKEELKNLKWDDFLATTRSSITTKGTKRRHVTRTTVPSSQSSGDEATEAAISTTNNAELDRSTPSTS